MFSCKDVAHHAHDHVEQNLSPWAKFKLFVHLAMCRHCRHFMRQLKITSQVIQKTPPVEQTDQQQIDDQVKRLMAARTQEKQSSD
jgi:hypothetical protein